VLISATQSKKSEAIMIKILTISGKALLTGVAVLLCANLAAQTQDAIEPPSIGQKTKGTPAIVETQEVSAVEYQATQQSEANDRSLFGDAKIIERRRENGQVYRVELEHPLGSRQYIDDDDMDGEIKTDNSSLEEAPNLAKWRLGSW
jgi:hypothetical protein